MMKQMLSNSYLFGANASYVEELYEAYLLNPAAVDAGWRDYFDKLANLPGVGAYNGPDVAHTPIINSFAQRAKEGTLHVVPRGTAQAEKQTKVLQLITAYRFLGNRWAQLDPLKRQERPEVAELDPAFYGFTEADLSTTFRTGSFDIGVDEATLREILEALRLRYCGQIGAEYMYLADVAQKRWIQARYEPVRPASRYTSEDKRRFLGAITAAETLERYLHTRYVGQKRFSLEGGESMILAMDQLVRVAGTMGVKEIVIGMAHRGRLNVLVNTLGKQPAMLFDEFEGKKKSDLLAGDVKYHMGYSSDVSSPGGPVHLTLAFNPSHLEIVNPVVEGSVYARQFHRGERGKSEVLPVLIHGDAAVAGQGVNQEMLNFSQTRGYGTGGTVHLVVNNQIGFTTSDPRDLRSSLYCTDIFKMVEAPIFHVNGDDPEAVAFVTQLALEFRQEFKKDVVVDIICFRKLGHNEQDEPMVTQPLMYKKVALHPGTRKLYAEKLMNQGVLAPGEDEQMIKDYRAALDAGRHLRDHVITDFKSPMAIDWAPYINAKYTEKCDTTVPLNELQRLGRRLTETPANFTLHPRVQKIVDDRKLMIEGKLPIDWGMAENLAYATLLAAGYGVRISGEDVGRGTFFHRHAAFHDQNREKWDEGTWWPLKSLQESQGTLQCFDSVLSEEAVLAFEYGYATATPNELVVWEGQFGDFANGAQVVIDQFLAAGEAKWGRACGLVMLLPHGYEGQGPEHSSARIERFMQLSADFNWEVCMPTTPSQIFHLLRRQMLRKQRKPLIIFTPKSLLRHKDATSSLDDLCEGTFQTIFGEVFPHNPKKITRVVCCTGKVFYDLVKARNERQLEHVAIIRTPQLYPMDDRRLLEELDRYPKMKELVWCQEEPENQGAWYAKHHRLIQILKKGQTLQLASRPASASPAVGSAAKHIEQQQAVVDAALGSTK
ncbi:MAG: 2-oxoglutarate dehydrogenase E1 component [Gammaproteobacteria bacterium]|nr:2-oxoglutarate dehydrogenase E1 component [Rhodocyclaceae bacterium]MBU3907655.1 2-oxoglutarate dehydrogenase E1 component [Gammaproteobacteria bacterium]MBU4004301.1 2-oxoglutarate dehydrogenase E1 component [Gammaproteobacteria bacterium]MBU4019710.1 2-oxoglutarate dehydrogenase E1 component [Gammaproteobacteria bacterium]MBU4095109.1 2-oxoglutarate dehydrogenase E1 component [Gammaproteobacteria bacterium]